jgi:Ca2+-binding RTX toxin-like protein
VTIVGTSGADHLIGTTGRDVIASLGGSDLVEAGAGDDLVCTGNGADRAFGEGGADVLAGGFGPDYLLGGRSPDDLIGGPGDDRVEGGRGDDALFGGAGKDVLLAGAGDDGPLVPGADDDVVVGSTGRDSLWYLFSNRGVRVDLAAGVSKGQGRDLVWDVEDVRGSPLRDEIVGDDAANELSGEGGSDEVIGDRGDDRLSGGAGADGLDGGPGEDTATFESSQRAVRASLARGIARGQGKDRLDGVENLSGSVFDDTITGDHGANNLYGDDGSDQIDGRAGDDFLVGGEIGERGDDQNHGGDGRDYCAPGGDETCEYRTHGDPAFVLTIDSPGPARVLQTAAFRGPAGRGWDFFVDLRSVRVAVGRFSARGCSWLRPSTERIVPGPCSAPVWVRAHYDESAGRWWLPLASPLRPGRYLAVACGNGTGCDGPAVEFRLR